MGAEVDVVDEEAGGANVAEGDALLGVGKAGALVTGRVDVKLDGPDPEGGTDGDDAGPGEEVAADEDTSLVTEDSTAEVAAVGVPAAVVATLVESLAAVASELAEAVEKLEGVTDSDGGVVGCERLDEGVAAGGEGLEVGVGASLGTVLEDNTGSSVLTGGGDGVAEGESVGDGELEKTAATELLSVTLDVDALAGELTGATLCVLTDEAVVSNEELVTRSVELDEAEDTELEVGVGVAEVLDTSLEDSITEVELEDASNVNVVVAGNDEDIDAGTSEETLEGAKDAPAPETSDGDVEGVAEELASAEDDADDRVEGTTDVDGSRDVEEMADVDAEKMVDDATLDGDTDASVLSTDAAVEDGVLDGSKVDEAEEKDENEGRDGDEEEEEEENVLSDALLLDEASPSGGTSDGGPSRESPSKGKTTPPAAPAPLNGRCGGSAKGARSMNGARTTGAACTHAHAAHSSHRARPSGANMTTCS